MITNRVLRLTLKDRSSEYFKVIEEHYKSRGECFMPEELEKELARVIPEDDTLIFKTPTFIKKVERKYSGKLFRYGSSDSIQNHSFLPFYEQHSSLCHMLKNSKAYTCSDGKTKEQILLRILAYAKRHKIDPSDACALFLLGNNDVVQGFCPSLEALTCTVVCTAVVISVFFAFINSFVPLFPALLIPLLCLCAVISELIASVTFPCSIILENGGDSNEERLLIISCDEGNYDKLMKRCESILGLSDNIHFSVAGVISPSPSFCLKMQYDSVFTENAEKKAQVLTEKYGNRFALYIRKRKYDPKKKCYYCHCDRFEDMYDLLTEDPTAFEYVYGSISKKVFAKALTMPVDCTIDGKALESLWKKLDSKTPMIKLSSEYRLSAKHTLFSRFCLGIDGDKSERQATHFTLSTPCNRSAYAFMCSRFCASYKSRPFFDVLSQRLEAKEDKDLKILSKSHISPISSVCNDSVQIMHLLNGYSSLPFISKLSRAYALIILFSPFICFYLILASVSSPFPSLYLAIAFFCISTVNSHLTLSFYTAIKSRSYAKALSLLCLYLFRIIYRISLLPFSFTVGCYLLFKKAISPFSGRTFHGIEDNSPGLFFVFSLSALLLGALFIIFDVNPIRRTLALIWLLSPAIAGILSITSFTGDSKKESADKSE